MTAGVWEGRLLAIPCKDCGKDWDAHVYPQAYIGLRCHFRPDYAAMAALVETALGEQRLRVMNLCAEEHAADAAKLEQRLTALEDTLRASENLRGDANERLGKHATALALAQQRITALATALGERGHSRGCRCHESGCGCAYVDPACAAPTSRGEGE